MVKRIWDEFLTDQDRSVFKASGYGSLAGFGKKPAVLIIDVNYNFLGDKPEPIINSIKKWPNSCGEIGWKALKPISKIILESRKKKLPLIYTTGEFRQDKWDRGSWAWKNNRTSKSEKKLHENKINGNKIIPIIEPKPTDIIVKKLKPSAFFGTNLQSFLTLLHVDSLIILGTTTSGCVRATVLDAFSTNYRVIVVEDGCFDRSESSHAINLCDMHAKYADVIHSNTVIKYIQSLNNKLFELPPGNI